MPLPTECQRERLSVTSLWISQFFLSSHEKPESRLSFIAPNLQSHPSPCSCRWPSAKYRKPLERFCNLIAARLKPVPQILVTRSTSNWQATIHSFSIFWLVLVASSPCLFWPIPVDRIPYFRLCCKNFEPPQFDEFENIHPQQHGQQRRGPTSATLTCLASARCR